MNAETCQKCGERITDVANCNRNKCPTMTQFNAWWLSSKYMQVVRSDKGTRQAALDGWQAAAQSLVKYVPVANSLRDKQYNHPNDNEPRSEALRAALRVRGDDEDQGLDGYWKWGFAAGFNAALYTAPNAQSAQPLRELSDDDIDQIANDGHRNAAGGIYATSVYDFARDVLLAARSAK